MKKVLLSLLLSIFSVFYIVEPFSLYASGNGFDSVNYQLVDYVVPDSASAYINTGYKPNVNTTIISKFSSTSVSTGFFYGVTSTVSGSSRSVGLKGGTNNYQIRTMNNNTNVNVTGSKFANNIIVTFNQSPTVTTITDGNTVYTSDTYQYGNYTLGNMFIFALNNNGPTSVNQYCKLYDMEIYENSTLIHKYYPCYRKSDDVVGIYDSVDSVFITSTGGTLSYGSIVSTNYTITTSVSPSGSGTVSGGGSYASGSVISLSATAYSGYVFDHWNDNSTSNPKTVNVTGNETYTAYFVQESTPTPSYTVSLSVSPSSSGTVTGGGSYSSGTSVQITAVPNNGYSFIKWSDDNTQNPRTIIVSDNLSLTAIFEEDSVDPDPPAPPSGWVDWTDTDDSEYLQEISNIDLTKIYWSVNFERVNDFVQIYQTQIQVNETYNGTSHVSVLGSYYDNSIVGLTGCNSSTYNYNTSTQTQTDVLTIQPAIYGQFDSNIGEDEGIMFDFGIAVNGNSSSHVTTNTTGFSNTTEACRLIGMNDGDSSVDGTTLLALGYQKKTITYNDGSASGHTATVYVPGNEQIDLEMDMSFLESLLDNLYLIIVNQTKVIAHDEFTIRFHGKDGYLFPEYGHVHADTFLGVLLSGLDFNAVHPFLGRIDERFYLIPQDNVYSNFNDTFSYHISDNMYDKNYVDLYWQETRNPVWKFKTNTFDHSLLNGAFRPNYTFNNDYGGYISSVAEAYTIKNEDLSIDPDLTAGALLKVGLASVNMYNFKSNSILNRFNQLGSFLQGWFKRIYDSIGSITGGNESNEIINNVVNEYDIDVETNFNGLLTNVENKKQQIDLTLPEYNIPSNDVSGIQGLASSFKNIYDEVYIDNGLGLLILIPVLLLVLRLIL